MKENLRSSLSCEDLQLFFVTDASRETSHDRGKTGPEAQNKQIRPTSPEEPPKASSAEKNARRRGKMQGKKMNQTG